MDDREIIFRRGQSIIAMESIGRKDFEEKYQAACDSLYWSQGQCCAGCDFWDSGHGFTGQCLASTMVSGDQVMKSIGADNCTYDPGPGFPFSLAQDWCGKFKDDFNWNDLDMDYLKKIGALNKNQLKLKPNNRMD